MLARSRKPLPRRVGASRSLVDFVGSKLLIDLFRGFRASPSHPRFVLTDDALDSIVRILGRYPNHLELAMYAVMWSEHCSYKSSRVHLGRLPTEAPWVLVGPGENAGVIDPGDGLA